MELALQIIGLGFIPLIGILVYSGLNDIYCGLKEHYGSQSFKISELPFNQKAHNFVTGLGFRKINSSFCRS